MEAAGLLSYAANNPGGNDYFFVYDSVQNELSFFVDGEAIHTTLANGFNLFDGQLHSVALSWDNTNGDWAVYVDGQNIASGSGVAVGQTIDPGGTLVFGQEQDSNGGGFDPDQVFSGTFFDVRVWDHVRTNSEIADGHQQKLDPNITHNGLVANWQFDGFDTNNQVVDIVSANNNALPDNNLTVAHVTEPGFTPSTPVDDLTVDENSSNGTSIGFVVASGGDAATLSYTLTDPDGRFTIDGSTGEITVLDGSLLNHEVNQTHVVTVEVSDSTSCLLYTSPSPRDS